MRCQTPAVSPQQGFLVGGQVFKVPLIKSVRPEPDGTTSHSTKPASGQVAGYVEG